MAKPELVLIDSSAWIETIRQDGDPAYGRQVDRLLTEERAATCEVVITEILRGAISEAELTALAEELRGLLRLAMDGAGEEGGRLAWALRRRGILVPTTDLLIAATARLNGAALLHRDRHLAEAAEALGLQAIEP
jgi:predicted nucleic acid-binding protein